MRMSQGDDLAGLGGVGQDFLVTRHGRVKNHFADRLTVYTNSYTLEQNAVLKCKYRSTGQLSASIGSLLMVDGRKKARGNHFHLARIDPGPGYHTGARFYANWPVDSR